MSALNLWWEELQDSVPYVGGWLGAVAVGSSFVDARMQQGAASVASLAGANVGVGLTSVILYAAAYWAGAWGKVPWAVVVVACFVLLTFAKAESYALCGIAIARPWPAALGYSAVVLSPGLIFLAFALLLGSSWRN